MIIKKAATITSVIVLSALVNGANAVSITTTFDGGNSNEGAMFDLTVFDNDITVTGLDLNFEDVGSTTIDVYTRVGGYQGFESSSDGWELRSSVSVGTTNSTGTATFLDLADFLLSANTTYGVYFYSRVHTVDLEYTNGDNSYTNSDLSITAGAGINNFFDGTYSPRTWNGTLYYSVPEPSTLALLALGLGIIGFSASRKS